MTGRTIDKESSEETPPTETNGEWVDLEETAASALGGRRVLRRVELFEPAPDAFVDDFPEMVVDAKVRARFEHHRLTEAIREKYCTNREVPILVTKARNEDEIYATVPLDWLGGLLNEIRRGRDVS